MIFGFTLSEIARLLLAGSVLAAALWLWARVHFAPEDDK